MRSTVKGKVYAGRPHWIHFSDRGVIVHPAFTEHYFCTRRCRKVRTWYFQVLIDGKVFATDNTGAWRPIFDAAHNNVGALRKVEGSINGKWEV